MAINPATSSSQLEPLPPTPPPLNGLPMDQAQDVPPLDPSAPDKMSDPYNLYGSGNDVLTKSYLYLEWIKMNPTNSNGAEISLLYMSNLADAGYFGTNADGTALSAGLLDIQNSAVPPKTLVAECVDITMEQIYITNGSNAAAAQMAHDQIYALFPEDQMDPVSVAARKEADDQLAVMSAPGYTTSQDGIQTEWYTFMTDGDTISSIDRAKSELLSASISSCGDNIYAALIVLLLLLEAAGITDMAAFGDLSDELADQTNELTILITDWESGDAYADAESAQAWMDDLQNLQKEMDMTAYSDTTITNIDTQFDTIFNQQARGYNYHSPQATYPNGDPMFVDKDGNYVNSSNQLVDANGNTLYTQQGKGTPGYDKNKNPNATNTVYYDPDRGYYYDEDNPNNRSSTDSTYLKQFGAGDITPVYDTTQPPQNNPPVATYSNGSFRYTDSQGNSVNSSGDKVNSDGSTINIGNTNQAPPQGSGTIPPIDTEDNLLYVDPSTGQTYYETSDGKYINATTGQPETPKSTPVPLTIGDQAFGNPSKDYKADSTGLQMSFEAFQPEAVNPDDPSQGGFADPDTEITNAIDALTKPPTQQSAQVGTMMSAKTSSIEMFQNTFAAILTDSTTGVTAHESTIIQNFQA